MSIRNDDSRTTGPREAPTIEDQILDAAYTCMLDFGLRRTTLAEVARRAGVSRPTVYRRWPDTRAIVADLLTREIRRLAPESSGTGPTRQRLVHAVVTTAGAIGAHPLFEKIVNTDPEVLTTYIVDRLGTSQRMLLDTLTAGIGEGQRDGSIRPGDPRRIAVMVLLTAQSVVQSARAVADTAPRDDMLTELGYAVDAYLAPNPEGTP
ncbi:TetR/AcrR family transcriptional regulator [Rhodococcus phenolicus]|uniref:TetR/AcrR family transcriptional regulator n=1 Tax=Rhodococcus phenolicus TaxID=263849 RepID=UPI00082F8E61|nr:TetR/AcrR family transcriptional regulator [Rhodococcus phenolicus]